MMGAPSEVTLKRIPRAAHPHRDAGEKLRRWRGIRKYEEVAILEALAAVAGEPRRTHGLQALILASPSSATSVVGGSTARLLSAMTCCRKPITFIDTWSPPRGMP